MPARSCSSVRIRPRNARQLIGRSGARSCVTAGVSTCCARPPLRYGPMGDTPSAPRLRWQLWALRPGLDGASRPSTTLTGRGGPPEIGVRRAGPLQRGTGGRPRATVGINCRTSRGTRHRREKRAWTLRAQVSHRASAFPAPFGRREAPPTGSTNHRCRSTYAVSSGVSFRCRQGVSFECRLTVGVGVGGDGRFPVVAAACAVLCGRRIDVLTEPTGGPFSGGRRGPFSGCHFQPVACAAGRVRGDDPSRRTQRQEPEVRPDRAGAAASVDRARVRRTVGAVADAHD